MVEKSKKQAKRAIKKTPQHSGWSPSAQYGLMAALLLLTFIVYGNGLNGHLLNFDDVEYFSNYPEVLKLTWHNVIKYFSGYYVIMYQPLPVLSFALNYHFSGLHTFPMHLLNLFFHLANIILVFSLIKKISDRFDVSFIVAVLFALHPMNVEAVTWISARSSGMYTCFYLAALSFYVDYLKKDLRWKYIALSFLFFILSLLSKAQAVTLPIVLLVFDYYYKRKLISFKTIAEKIPFFLLAVLFGIITLSDTDTQSNITKGMMVNYSPVDTFFLICYSFIFYIYKLLLPLSLSAVYVYPPKENGWLPLLYYAAPAILACILVLIYKWRHKRFVIFGAALFLITISLNVQIIPSRLFIVTERYAYFPYIGLYFILAMLYVEISGSRKWKKGFLWGITISAMVFSVIIYGRNSVWASDIPFMTDVIEKNPEVPYLYRAYGNRGHAQMEAKNYPDAITDFSEAIRLKPDDWSSYFNRGLCYVNIQNLQEGIADYNRAIEKGGKYFIVYSNRALAKSNAKDYKGAIADCNEAIKLDSSQYDIYNTKAVSEFALNDTVGVERDLKRAVDLNPSFDLGFKNLGNLYYQTRRFDEACKEWRSAALLGNTEAQSAQSTYCK
jgi:tetratricopeptide (TPR) repeat protein